jgi:hypothetical protein
MRNTAITVQILALALAGAAMAAGPGKSRLAAGQSAEGFGSALMGFVAGENGVRGLYGIPGASRFGEVAPIAGLSAVTVAPGKSFAIGLTGGGARIIDLASGAAVDIEGGFAGADRVTFSPSGTAALIEQSGSGAAQLVTGLPDHPAAGGQFLLNGAVSWAVSDDGAQVLAARRDGVWLLTSDGAVPVAHLSDFGALAFAPGSHEAVVADYGSHAVTLLHPVEGGYAAARLAGAGEGIDSPRYAAFAGTAVLIASGAAAKLWWVDGTTGAVEPMELPARASRLDATAYGLFVISAAAGEPAWLAGREGNSGRLYFVPAAE